MYDIEKTTHGFGYVDEATSAVLWECTMEA
jgi:hypothetical protein